MTADGIPKLYYVSDIAAAWQVDQRWILTRLRDGRFEGVRISNKWAMTEAQMSAALETVSNRDKRKLRVERDEWRPPNGMSPRSWAYHQRYPDGNPNMSKPRGSRKKPLE